MSFALCAHALFFCMRICLATLILILICYNTSFLTISNLFSACFLSLHNKNLKLSSILLNFCMFSSHHYISLQKLESHLSYSLPPTDLLSISIQTSHHFPNTFIYLSLEPISMPCCCLVWFVIPGS